jgi:hypothetical protein
MRSLMICTPHPIFFGQNIENEMGRACSTLGKGELYTWFWWGNLKKIDHLGDPGLDERIIFRWIFRKWEV